MVKASPSNARGAGSILSRGAKIPHALKLKNQNLKKKTNKQKKKGSGEKLVNEVGVSLWSDRNVLEQWLHSIVNVLNATELFPLNG